jgi:virginiamycin A acetyltransferase
MSPVIRDERSYLIGEIYDPFDIEVRIGKYTSIAEGFQIIASDHPMKEVSTFPFKEFYGLEYAPCTGRGPVVIGNDVWVGMGVSVKHGVSIGDGAVIAAKSVVVNDVAPYALVAGNPAVVKKFRFEKKVSDKLISIAWWNWDFDLIKARLGDFLDTGVFIDKYYKE